MRGKEDNQMERLRKLREEKGREKGTTVVFRVTSGGPYLLFPFIITTYQIPASFNSGKI